MRYKIEKKTGKPGYMQLYAQLRNDIVSGYYPFGMRLPSKRTLSDNAEVSVITVEHAYALLAEEGYVAARERSGYFVCYRKMDLIGSPEADLPGSGQRRKSMQNQRSLQNGQPDLRVKTGQAGTAETPPRERDNTPEFPFSLFARTARSVLTNRGKDVLTPSESSGSPELRSAIADYLARSRGIVVHPDQILIGAGAEYLYGLAVQMIGRERVYALEDPSYEKIRQVYEANGVQCEMLRLGPEGILSEELVRTNAGVLHVTPFNSYPSGITATASKRTEYVQWAVHREALIIEDDYDSEFSELTKAEDTLFSLEPERTVLYINTFSRTIAPAMRMGYMVLPAARCREMKEKISFYTCTVPVFEQYVLAEFIREGHFERHINRVRRQRRRAQQERKD
ncbi:MAG: PLP-dependent aminotransferase family protein [Eubacterium sp.]|nr:PLP-dependent aminotransferase family protein [Eubacterium sp.]